MTTLSLSPQSVFNLSETLVIIPRFLRCTGSINAQYYYERVHVDVLRYIAEPTPQTLGVATESIEHAHEAIKSYRDTVNCVKHEAEYSAAHNAVFKYFILKRELELAQKVNDLEKSEA